MTGFSLSKLVASTLLPLAVVAQCYNDTSGGVLPGPTWPSTYDLLKRNAFVTREGSSLYLLGKEFRMVGPNIYWLGSCLFHPFFSSQSNNNSQGLTKMLCKREHPKWLTAH